MTLSKLSAVAIVSALALTASAEEVTFTLPWDGSTVTADATVAENLSGNTQFGAFTQTTVAERSAIAATVKSTSAKIDDIAGLQHGSGSKVTLGDADIYLNIAGGTAKLVVGGWNAAWANKDNFATWTKGSALVQIGGGAVDYVFGAGYQGYKLNVNGNSGVTIAAENALKGSAFGGWSSEHNESANVGGNTAVRVLAVQGANEADLISYDGTARAYGIANNLIVGGSAYGCNTTSGATMNGNSSVVVDVSDVPTAKTFSKRLVGGSYACKKRTGGDSTLTNKKNTYVEVTASNNVTFSADIVGGSLIDDGSNANVSTVVSGNASVTLNGGTYTGTITAGGVGASDKSTVAGTATLTLKKGNFTGATLAGGNADGDKILVIDGSPTLPTAVNISGFTVLKLARGDYSSQTISPSTVPGWTSEMAELVIGAGVTLTGAIISGFDKVTIDDDADLSGTLTINANTKICVGTRTWAGTLEGTGTLLVKDSTLTVTTASRKAKGFESFEGTIEVAEGGKLYASDTSANCEFPATVAFKMSGGEIEYLGGNTSLYINGTLEIAEGTTSTFTIGARPNFNVEGALTGSGTLKVYKPWENNYASRKFRVKGETKDFAGTLTMTEGNGFYTFEDGKDVVTLGALNTNVGDFYAKKNSTIIVGSKEDCKLQGPFLTDGTAAGAFTLVKVGDATTLTLEGGNKEFKMPDDSQIIVSNGTLYANSTLSSSSKSVNLAKVTVKVCEKGILKGQATVKSVEFEAGANIDALPDEPNIGATYDIVTTTVEPDISAVKNAVVGGTGANNGNGGKGMWRVKVRTNDDDADGTPESYTLYAEYLKPGVTIVIL